MQTKHMKRTVIVFAQEHYNPLNIIRALGEGGICPVYISVKRRYELASKSKYISKLHKVLTIEEGYTLLIKEYAPKEGEEKPFILFSDDRCIGYFDDHYDEWKDKFIGFNAGRKGRINEFMDKYNVQILAKKHGFNIIDSHVISKDDRIPENLWYPVITKDISPNSGNWKNDVFICKDEEELKAAITRITSPKIMIQHFVDKLNEMTLEGYSIRHGEELQIATQIKYKYLIPGYYSPFMDVSMFTDKEMEYKLVSMFKEIAFEGLFEVEFLIDKDGIIYFMEINFRASAWNPTGMYAEMPLPNLWMKGMINGKIDPDDRKDFDTFTAMVETIDYGKRVEGGMCSLGEWLKDFKQAKCTFIYNKDDIEPWNEACRNWDKFK